MWAACLGKGAVVAQGDRRTLALTGAHSELAAEGLNSGTHSAQPQPTVIHVSRIEPLAIIRDGDRQARVVLDPNGDLPGLAVLVGIGQRLLHDTIDAGPLHERRASDPGNLDGDLDAGRLPVPLNGQIDDLRE